MLTIKDHSGADLATLEIGKGSKRVFMLMSEDYITLKFSLAEPVRFGIGSYVIVDGFGRFELTELYQPKQNAKTGGWDYEIQLDAHYIKWKNKIFKYNPEDGGGEASWNLTATLATHLGVFLRNLVALGYDYNGVPYTFAIDSTVSDSARLITYECKNMLDALYDMADTFECEVWVEDSVIHFGKCEYGEAVDFRQDVNVESMSAEGNRATYATRVYAFGSDKNLPSNYRPISPSITVNGVVQKRLMLPADTPYIDSKPNLDSVEAVEQVIIFDDVYPRTKSEISDITTVEYDEQDDDGNATGETWTAYRFKMPGFVFSEDYILPDTDLQATFQTGSLAGMTFDVKFNPLEKGASESDYQLWEIIRNEDYGRPLPDDTLKPSAGDKIVVIGWDSTKIASLGLIDAAEQELKQRAIEKIKELKIDPANYRCKMISATMIDDGGAWQPYTLGSRVNLINQGCFESGQRASRIIGYEYDLARPYNSPVYIVGEKSATSRTKELESKIEALTIAGQTYSSTGNGSNIYVIRTNDSTAPSDTNVFSASRTKRDFLSRINPDTAQGLITFLQGLIAKGDATFEGSAKSDNFVEGLYDGSGWKVDRQGNMELTSLRVRDFLEVLQLIINRLQAVQGDVIYTEGDTIETVTLVSEEERTFDLEGGTQTTETIRTYNLGLKSQWEGYFTAQTEGAILKGVYNSLAQAAYQGGTAQVGAESAAAYYTCYMRVNSVNQAANSINVTLYPSHQCPAGVNYPPCELMNIARIGHQTDSARQTHMMVSSSEGFIRKMRDVDAPTTTEDNIAVHIGKLPEFVYEQLVKGGYLSPTDPDIEWKKQRAQVVVADYIIGKKFVAYDRDEGVLPTRYIDRGNWVQPTDENGVKYYHKEPNPDSAEETLCNEISCVWHYGCKWACMANLTTTEPKYNNTDWAFLEGNPNFTIEFLETEELYDLEDFSCPLTIRGWLYNQDITASLRDADVEWTRYSEFADGTQRVTDDTAWALQFAQANRSGLAVTLTRADLGADNGYLPKNIKFTATAYLPDGLAAAASLTL